MDSIAKITTKVRIWEHSPLNMLTIDCPCKEQRLTGILTPKLKRSVLRLSLDFSTVLCHHMIWLAKAHAQIFAYAHMYCSNLVGAKWFQSVILMLREPIELSREEGIYRIWPKTNISFPTLPFSLFLSCMLGKYPKISSGISGLRTEICWCIVMVHCSGNVSRRIDSGSTVLSSFVLVM